MPQVIIISLDFDPFQFSPTAFSKQRGKLFHQTQKLSFTSQSHCKIHPFYLPGPTSSGIQKIYPSNPAVSCTKQRQNLEEIAYSKSQFLYIFDSFKIYIHIFSSRFTQLTTNLYICRRRLEDDQKYATCVLVHPIVLNLKILQSQQSDMNVCSNGKEK